MVNHPKRKAEQEIPLVLSAELKLGTSVMVVSDRTDDASAMEMVKSVVFCLKTSNVEAAFAKAVASGAVAEGEISEGEGACCGGRVGKCSTEHLINLPIPAMAGIYAFKCPCFRPPFSTLPQRSNPFQVPRLKFATTRPSTFHKIDALTSNDIKVGLNIEVDGNPWKVIEFLHVKPGKGAAFVRTMLRNYVTGNQVEKTFRAGSKIEEADILKETKQFSYKDGAQYVFMDLTTYEEYRLNESDVGDKSMWLKEGMDCNLLFWKDKIIDFELPNIVKLTVVQVDPGIKGDTVQGGSKPATLETGAVVTVPLFINIGDEILVDTRTGQYTSRV
ncbi:elongation factor P [Striga asiatica]|uniref:Elongation factor P n=1 Tax=Striga asiatica TaxID=4170 RepID=A0A5A7RD97_STRAF|nr:elongation factor P [Striga asiatica]